MNQSRNQKISLEQDINNIAKSLLVNKCRVFNYVCGY